MESDANITELLSGWRNGDEASRELLFDQTYEQLRIIARGVLSGDRQRFAIQPTELVNECSMRLFGLDKIDWHDRAHFVAMATTAMRRVLIDQARRKRADKREGLEITLLTHHAGYPDRNVDVERVDETLCRLEAISSEKAKIVELKFFGGLTNEEVAEVLEISESSVKRGWRAARAWMYSELND